MSNVGTWKRVTAACFNWQKSLVHYGLPCILISSLPGDLGGVNYCFYAYYNNFSSQIPSSTPTKDTQVGSCQITKCHCLVTQEQQFNRLVYSVALPKAILI